MKRFLVSFAAILVACSLYGQKLTSNVIGLTVGRTYSEETARTALKGPGSRVASTRTEINDIAMKGAFRLLDREWSDVILLSRGKGGIVFRYNCRDNSEAAEFFKDLIPAADAAYSPGRRITDTAYIYAGEGGNVEMMMQILPGQENTISLYFTRN